MVKPLALSPRTPRFCAKEIHRKALRSSIAIGSEIWMHCIGENRRYLQGEESHTIELDDADAPQLLTNRRDILSSSIGTKPTADFPLLQREPVNRWNG